VIGPWVASAKADIPNQIGLIELARRDLGSASSMRRDGIGRHKKPTRKPTIPSQGVRTRRSAFCALGSSPRVAWIFAIIWDSPGLSETTPGRATDQKVAGSNPAERAKKLCRGTKAILGTGSVFTWGRDAGPAAIEVRPRLAEAPAPWTDGDRPPDLRRILCGLGWGTRAES